MWLWKRDCRCLVVVFVFLLVVSFVVAKDIEVDIPNKVDVDEEFVIEVKLIDFPKDEYDLKIDIFGDGERISEIDNKGWKSTHFYVNEVFDDFEAEVDMRISDNFEGDADIVIKIRNSKGTTNTFEGYEIEVDERKEETNEEEKKESSDEEIIESEVDSSSDIDNSTSKIEVISLQPKSIKNSQDSEVIFTSSNGKIKQYAIYGFALFMVLIIVLLLMERRR